MSISKIQQRCSLLGPKQFLEMMVETLVLKGLARYEDADPFRGSVPSCPFLFVPPRPDPLDWRALMKLVVVDGKEGATNLCNPEQIRDVVLTIPRSSDAYIVVGIEDGTSRLGVDQSKSEMMIYEAHRSPLTALEGLVCSIIFPETLKDHNFDFGGSRMNGIAVPIIHLNELEEGRPELFACWGNSAEPRFGMPSCGERRVA